MSCTPAISCPFLPPSFTAAFTFLALISSAVGSAFFGFSSSAFFGFGFSAFFWFFSFPLPLVVLGFDAPAILIPVAGPGKLLLSNAPTCLYHLVIPLYSVGGGAAKVIKTVRSSTLGC